MAATVVDRFLALAGSTPNRPLFQFVGDDGHLESTLTARELRDQATATASWLLDQGFRPGDRVVLAYLPCAEFVVAFTATLLTGVIAVPVAPPDPYDLAKDLPRFSAMVADSGACAVLSHRRYLRARTLAQARGMVGRLFGRAPVAWPELPWHATDGATGRSAFTPARARASDVALLQYTSGSTSAPRGVRITHGNLAHQLDCNAEELGLDAASHAVIWLPHFHDFGLVSGILSALRGNGLLTMMSPLTFIKRPELWLEHLSRGKATHTAAPNFAYELVVRKTTPAQRAGWDLSSLRVAMSAAEPIREDVVQAFCAAFAPSGFRPQAFCPAYGLAEHTVGVSVGGRGRLRVSRRALEIDRVARPVDVDGPGTRALVGCGRPSHQVVVRIVDPDTLQVRDEGEVGEIWVDSPSKADGYWGLPELSREVFEAKLAGPGDGRAYLRTGDLGFLHGGEVYVTGRLKDLVIVRGRNVAPQDLEASVRAAHPAIKPGSVAAFAVDRTGADEALVLLVEAREAPSKATAEAIATAVRRAIAAEHHLACDIVIVGGPGVVRKTTSGKVRRQACRQAWLDGELTGAQVFDGSADAVDELPEVAAAPPPVDPRFDVEPAFRAMLTQAARYLGSGKGEKSPSGIGLHGELVVDPDPELPRSTFFVKGRAFRTILRHDNRTSADDAAPDARVAGLRLFDAGSAPALDLPMLTGSSFFHRTASDFFKFTVAPAPAREAILRAEPHRAAAAWATIRAGDSYTAFHYFSQSATRFEAADGALWYARYRLRAPERLVDEGAVDSHGVLFPPTGAPRDPADPRSPTVLRDELRSRIGKGSVDYELEVQVRRADEGPEDELLDCTRPWTRPWRRIARLRCDTLAPEAVVQALELNPRNAPPELGVVWARTASASASIDHVRSIIYEVAAAARRGRPLDPELAAWLAGPEAAPAPAPAAAPTPVTRIEGQRHVVIVGAGASGLTAARELERRGVRVTVIEREARVGGMCRTEVVDGVPCDLGGHMIFKSRYPTIAGLAAEVGQRLVPDFPDTGITASGKLVAPRDVPREARARVARLVEQAGAHRPGLLGVDRALSLPIRDWLERERLGEVWDWMGSVFAGAGYGYLDDEIPAAYLAKSFAHTHTAEDRYQLEGGFQTLWERVAAGLSDVRTSTAVVGCRRDERGVALTLRGPHGEREERFDQLVIAHAPGRAAWLDTTAEERELFSKVRTLRYTSALAEVDGLPDALRERWCFVSDNTASATRRGHVLSFVQVDRARPIVGFIAYEPADPAAAEALAREDFARMGATLRRVITWQPWSYFPHFGSEDLAAGALGRLEGLQGQRSTWHASTLMSFELTECAAAYARELAGRIATSLGQPEAPTRAHRPEDGFGAFRKAVEAERARVLAWLVEVVRAEIGRRPPVDVPLGEIGVDSMRAAVIHQRVCDDTGLELDPSAIFDTTLRALAVDVVGRLAAPPEPERAPVPVRADTATDDLLRQIQA